MFKVQGCDNSIDQTNFKESDQSSAIFCLDIRQVYLKFEKITVESGNSKFGFVTNFYLLMRYFYYSETLLDFLEMLIVFLILALILATPMGILYKLTYSGHEMYGLRPFCTPYETDYGHHKRKEDGNRSAFSIN